ncbi:MAG: choice-of-anchor J domain-containing protein [Bacteroidales bacterium]
MKHFYCLGSALALLLALWLQPARAQAPHVEIGQGTILAGLPIHPYFGYSYSQSIFLQEELDTEGKRIHKLAFYYQGGSRWSDNVSVYLAHTTQETLSGYITEGLTLVYEGALAVMNQEGWVEIALTNPFEYNNTDNLLLAMKENTPGFRLNSAFYSTDSGANRSVLATKDGSPAYDVNNPPANFQVKSERPNIRLWFEDLPAGPAVSIQPPQLYFLYIRENEEKMLSVSVVNTGVEPLQITGLQSQGLPFSTQFSGTLQPGQSQLVDIRFVPDEVGDFAGHITLETNTSVDPVYLYVEGFARPEMAVIETFASATFPPEGWAVGEGSWTRRGFGGFEGPGNAYLNTGTQPGYLVTPKLNIQEDDQLIFYAYQTLNGELTVSHSYDMEEWTVLQHILLTGQYQRYSIDLDQVQGPGYIGFSGIPRLYVDYVVAPEIHLELPPNPVGNPVPQDELWNAFVTQWLAWSASNLAEGYRVYLGTDNPPTNLIDGQDVGNVRRFKTPVLQHNTTYYWQIVPYNHNGDAQDCPVWSFTTIAFDPVADFPFTEGFETEQGQVPPPGWINQDGHWTTTQYAHSGQFAARASFNHPVDAVMISPPLELPSDDQMELVFYWKNGNLFKEAHKVVGYDTLYVEITSDYGQNWSLGGIFSAPSPMTHYMPARVGLEALAGQVVHIRFRHSTNGNPNFAMPVAIDDIAIQSAAQQPILWLSHESWDAGSIANNTWITSETITLRNLGAGVLSLDQVSFSGEYFTTTLDPQEVALEFGQEYTFTLAFEPFADGSFPNALSIHSNGGNAQIVLSGESLFVPPFAFDGFEGGVVPPHGWMNHDEDGDEIFWLRAWNHAIPAHTGTFSAVSFSYVAGLGDLTPDNWLVTPKIHVGQNQEFFFWVACGSPNYPADHYKVLVSTTTNRLDQFTHILHEETLKAENAQWSERVFDLTPWAGQQIYIAFRHTESVGQDYVKLDDIGVRDALVVEAPYGDPAPGAVVAGTQVSLISDTPDAQIFYTLNGDDPHTGSTLFQDPISITMAITIKAVAHKNGTYSDVVALEYTIDDTSVHGPRLVQVQMYPNPASQKVYFEKANGEAIWVQIISLSGQVMLQRWVDQQVTSLDISSLSAGTYLVRLQDNQTVNFRKLVIR